MSNKGTLERTTSCMESETSNQPTMMKMCGKKSMQTLIELHRGEM